MNDVQKLEQELAFWQQHAEEATEEDWQRAVAVLLDVQKNIGQFFVEQEKKKNLQLSILCFLVTSEHLDFAGLKYASYMKYEQELDFFDCFGNHPMMPLWIEVEENDPNFMWFLRRSVFARRHYAIYYFGGLGLSSRRVDKELAAQFQQLASASRSIMGKPSRFESKTSKTLRHSLEKLRKELMNLFPNEYQDTSLKICVLEDRLTEEILRIGGIENKHPGILACLHTT